MTALKAGAVYFASVFGVGFAFGTIRVFLLEPQFGALSAVLMETPFMLVACWFLSSFWVRKLNVDTAVSSRLIMGGVAFALLIAAELLLGRYGFGRSLGDQFAAMTTASGATGLAGQMLFGLFPLLQAKVGRDA